MPSSSPEAKPGCCGTPSAPIGGNSTFGCCGTSPPTGERSMETDTSSRSLVCECAKCTCAQCRCNVPVNQRAAASRASLSQTLSLRVSLPHFTPISPSLKASATIPATSFSLLSPGIPRENSKEKVPACVVNAALRAKCGSRVRCAFVDVKYALLRSLAADARAVVFVADEYGGDANLIAITVDVILAPSTGVSLDAISSACSSILCQRGYSVSPVTSSLSPTLSAGRKSGHATPKQKTRSISPGQFASGRSTIVTINDAFSHEPQAPSVKKITSAIVGMTCKSCTRTITSGLHSISGLVQGTLVVDLDASDERILEELDSITWVTHKRIGQATMQLDFTVLTAQKGGAAAVSDIGSFVKDRIESFGFEVLVTFVDDIHGSNVFESFPSHSYESDRVPLIDHSQPQFLVSEGEQIKTSIILSGLSCSTCVQSVESAMRRLPGITSLQVTLFPHQRAVVVHSPDTAPVSTLLKAIENIGFEVLDHSSSMELALPNFLPWISAGTLSDTPRDVQPMQLTSHAKSPFIEPGRMNVGSSGALLDAGREDVSTTTKLDVGGMTCASCVASVERVVAGLDGVQSVSVSLLTNLAVVKHDASKIGARSIMAAISDAGFTPGLSLASNIQSVASERSREELLRYQHATFVAFLFAFPALVVSMVIGMALPDSHPVRQWIEQEIAPGLSLRALVMVILATPMQFWIGWRFYVGAWKSLWFAKSANMDVLVALGTSAAYFYSLVTIIQSLVTQEMAGHEYFETSILLIFFILLGKYLESYAKGKTGEAVTKLVGLTPDSVTVVHVEQTGHSIIGMDASELKVVKEEVVDIGLIEVGDIIKVPVGSRFPCDAILISGSTHADESMLTGEPIPLFKCPGDPVTGGTLNATSPVLVKAVHIGADTVLSRIVQCVQDAQMSKAPIQAVADRVSRVFVPAVVAISALTFVIWLVVGTVTGPAERGGVVPAGSSAFGFALNFAIGVLVIACPCALGLATPTAVMVGTGIAAKYGILVKGGGAALQTASEIKTIIFDKTGTLTLGKPTVTDSIICGVDFPELASLDSLNDELPHFTEAEIFALISFAESSSAHPLAVAAAIYATDHSAGVNRGSVGPNWRIGEVREVAGMGLSIDLVYSGPNASNACLKNSRQLLAVIGSRRWVEDKNHCQVIDATRIQAWEKTGKTAVYVGVCEAGQSSGRVLAVLAISDPPRPSSLLTVTALQRMGIRVVMMTGDQRTTAEAVAKLVGIDAADVVAGCLPTDKGTQVLDIKAEMNALDQRGKVAFAGDGINDSIALANADVGIALGGGSDIAIESADVVLLRSELTDIVILVKLSQIVLRRIYLNMGGAFFYNCVGIPIAAGALFIVGNGFMLAPWIAGLAMAMSSVTVVVSSLALRLFRP